MIPDNIILQHAHVALKYIKYDLRTGQATPCAKPEHNNYYGYNQFSDETYWGYFFYEGKSYFFHGKNIYPIGYAGNEFKIEHISNTQAKFSFFKDGDLLEQTLYPRMHGDDWSDEEDFDIFYNIRTRHKAWKAKQQKPA